MNNSFAAIAASGLAAIAAIDQLFLHGAGMIMAGRLTLSVIDWLAVWR